MTLTQDQATWFAQTFETLSKNIGGAVLGKKSAVDLALICLLSDGHLLLEDVPGTGKTSLAKSLANTVSGSQSRIQFTPDLLPSDVTGATIYNQRTSEFEFHQGPIFATIVLVDEINRASPKTQSALLEVMEEGRVTVDGIRHSVGEPFMVIATQNPVEQAGVYPLPEAQLDRFLMRTSLGYPDHDNTVALLADASNKDRSRAVQPLITAQAVVQMSGFASEVYVDPAILSYATQLAEYTRSNSSVKLPISTRGLIALTRVAKTRAISLGRSYALPDDIKALIEPVFGHRIALTADAEFAGATVDSILGDMLSAVQPPEARVA